MKHKPLIEAETVPGHSFEVTGEAARKRQELAEKGLNVDEILLELLQKREDEIAKEKNMIGAEPAKSRHIPVKVRRIIHKEHGKICSIQSCKKPSEHIHHTQTFALGKTHDPHFLAPLCKEHHTLAHTVNLKVRKKTYANVVG